MALASDGTVQALTPLDLIMPRFYTRMMLTFDLSDRSDTITPAAQTLQDAFAALTTEAPLLSGALKAADEGKDRLAIHIPGQASLSADIKTYPNEAVSKNDIDQANAAIGVMAAADGSVLHRSTSTATVSSSPSAFTTRSAMLLGSQSSYAAGPTSLNLSNPRSLNRLHSPPCHLTAIRSSAVV